MITESPIPFTSILQMSEITQNYCIDHRDSYQVYLSLQMSETTQNYCIAHRDFYPIDICSWQTFPCASFHSHYTGHDMEMSLITVATRGKPHSRRQSGHFTVSETMDAVKEDRDRKCRESAHNYTLVAALNVLGV